MGFTAAAVKYRFWRRRRAPLSLLAPALNDRANSCSGFQSFSRLIRVSAAVNRHVRPNGLKRIAHHRRAAGSNRDQAGGNWYARRFSTRCAGKATLQNAGGQTTPAIPPAALG